MRLDLIYLLEKSNLELDGALIRTDIGEYVDKLISKACIHTIYEKDQLMGFIAYYDNDISKTKAYLSMIAVDPEHYGKGYGKKLMDFVIHDLINKNFKYFELEVLKSNTSAIKFYETYNFQIVESKAETKYFMRKKLDLC